MEIFKRISNLVSGKRSKWVTLAVWIIVVGALSAIWPGVNQMEKNNAANLDDGKPSVVAGKLAETEFPADSGLPALIIWSREGGLTDGDFGAIQELTAYFTQHPAEGQETLPPFDKMPVQALKQQASEDGTTFVLPFFFKKTSDSDTLKEGTEAIRKQAETQLGSDPFAAELESGDLTARVSGPAGISIDAVGLFSDADVSLMIATVLLVLVLLLLIYRSPILALIPLIAVGFAFGAASPILGKMAELGWITVDSQAISIMTVLLFGAGTDYCLFLISRFRQLLTVESNKAKALTSAFKDSSGAIAMSGFTVVIALLVLLLAEYGSVNRFAVPFSLSILIMALASLTLVPALLAIMGRTSFYPFIPRTPEMEAERSRTKGIKRAAKTKRGIKFGERVGNVVTKRPWLVVIVTLVLLVAAALNAFRIQYTVDLLSSFPEDAPSREGYTVIADKFTPGELAPVKIMIDTEGKDAGLKQAIEALPYIGKVTEPVNGQNNPDIVAVDAEFAMNPYSIEAVNHVPNLRETAEKVLTDAGIGGAEGKVWISGQPATQYDTEMTNNRDAEIVIPAVIGLIAILLLVYLRSVVATVYLILTVVLSYFSALGLGWVVVHDIMGDTAIQGLIPLYAFVFLVALGEDYNIFLISSIWKKRKTMPLKAAIREGVAETGGVITSAGLILAGTFAVLATLPIQVLVQFGIITAIGVLLDTFVVRPFLVPSITVLLGKWAFWPGKMTEINGSSVEQTESVSR